MHVTGSATTGATDAVPVPSTGTATEVGSLTSSPPGRGQSWGGALLTPNYTPGDCQTSWVYSSNPVLHLYISFYATVNKPVLSYLFVVLASTHIYILVPTSTLSYEPSTIQSHKRLDHPSRSSMTNISHSLRSPMT